VKFWGLAHPCWCRRAVILHRLVGLSLVAAVVVLAAAAHASPPDQTWIVGLYDNADFDDVILLITSNLSAVDPGVVSSSHPVAAVVGVVATAASFPPTASPLSFGACRAPPLA
jgi:hypothetical protein